MRSKTHWQGRALRKYAIRRYDCRGEGVEVKVGIRGINSSGKNIIKKVSIKNIRNIKHTPDPPARNPENAA